MYCYEISNKRYLLYNFWLIVLVILDRVKKVIREIDGY